MKETKATFFAGVSGKWGAPVRVDENHTVFKQESNFTGLFTFDDGTDIAIAAFMTGYDKARDDGLVTEARGHSEFLDEDGDRVWLTLFSYPTDDGYGIEFEITSGTGKWERAKGILKGSITPTPGSEGLQKYAVIEAQGAIQDLSVEERAL